MLMLRQRPYKPLSVWKTSVSLLSLVSATFSSLYRFTLTANLLNICALSLK